MEDITTASDGMARAVNDNLTWSLRTTPVQAGKDARNSRAAQVGKLVQSKRKEEIGQKLQLQQITAGLSAAKSDAAKESGDRTQQANGFITKDSNAYEFNNARLNRTTAAKPDQQPVPAAPIPATDSGVARPNLFVQQSSASGEDNAGLKAVGRASLRAVFPSQENVVHFKKVKDHANMKITLSPAITSRLDLRALLTWAGIMAGVLGCRLLAKWIAVRKLNRRSRLA